MNIMIIERENTPLSPLFVYLFFRRTNQNHEKICMCLFIYLPKHLSKKPVLSEKKLHLFVCFLLIARCRLSYIVYVCLSHDYTYLMLIYLSIMYVGQHATSFKIQFPVGRPCDF